MKSYIGKISICVTAGEGECMSATVTVSDCVSVSISVYVSDSVWLILG